MANLDDVEAAILTQCIDDWQKVAWVISSACAQQGVPLRSSLIWGPLGTDDLDQECELHINGVKSLLEKGKLLLRGNLSEPRFSEVRLVATQKALHLALTSIAPRTETPS